MKRWIHAAEELYRFPEKIWIEVYPETHNGYEYVKDYEHEGGGCYYRSPENDDPIAGSFVSLYPDGRLTYLWNGQEKPLNREWYPIEDNTNINASETIAPWNDPEVEYVCNTNGWWCYRKIEDGKGKWYAHEQDTPVETMIPISYAQVRGYEPMPEEASAIRKLQRDLGKMLLPPEGYVGAASKADATNELSADILDVFERIVGPIWRILESNYGGLIVVSEDRFKKSEAERVEIKLNNELKRLGLSKHITRVAYYFAGASSEDDSIDVLRIAMYLKRYVEL